MAELIVTLKGREVQRLPISSHAVYIGRAPQCDLVLPNESVSREHASLSFTIKGFTLQPLSDTNGLWINGHLCSKATPLADHDRIQVGKYIIELSIQTGPPLSILQAGSFEQITHTTALDIVDLERYREEPVYDYEPRSLDEIRQARTARLVKQLWLTRGALILSLLFNAWLLLRAWHDQVLFF